MGAHVHLKPTWQQPPGSCASVHCPGMEQAFWPGPLQGLEAGMVYRQSGSVYRLGFAVCSDRSGTPVPCSSCGPAWHALHVMMRHVQPGNVHRAQQPKGCKWRQHDPYA